jgi:hypothetical protein
MAFWKLTKVQWMRNACGKTGCWTAKPERITYSRRRRRLRCFSLISSSRYHHCLATASWHVSRRWYAFRELSVLSRVRLEILQHLRERPVEKWEMACRKKFRSRTSQRAGGFQCQPHGPNLAPWADSSKPERRMTSYNEQLDSLLPFKILLVLLKKRKENCCASW